MSDRRRLLPAPLRRRRVARNGNSPMEIPVNYVARGFDEGKKIRFWRDAIPSYAAFFKYRFK